MKKIAVVLSFLLLHSLAFCQSATKAISLASNSSVYIYATDSSGELIPIGTGWFYNNTTIVTAKHVVTDYEKSTETKEVPWKKITIITAKNETLTAVNTALSSKYDVAKITIKKPKKTYIPLKMASQESIKGDLVCGVGYDIDYDSHAFIGWNTGTRQDGFTRGQRFSITNADINPGHSGSAVLNVKGEVVGIAIGIDNRVSPEGDPVRGVSFFIPLTELKTALKNIK